MVREGVYNSLISCLLGLGAREFEAVDPTLFPHSLLPLIKFLLYSLVPRHSDATPTSKTTPSSDHTHSNGSVDLLECSELARQVVWACMVEDPRLFFRPLLHKFNKIYMLGQENKRSLESLMVRGQGWLVAFDLGGWGWLVAFDLGGWGWLVIFDLLASGL